MDKSILIYRSGARPHTLQNVPLYTVSYMTKRRLLFQEPDEKICQQVQLVTLDTLL